MNKYRVALVDDDKIYHFVAERLLHRLQPDMEVTWLRDGEEALYYLLDRRTSPSELPQIMIVDVNMPIMNGWEFVEAVQEVMLELPAQIQFYMISSSNDLRDVEKAKAIPIVKDFIEKPITIEKLAAILS